MKASHLVIPALIADGTITWCGRENRVRDLVSLEFDPGCTVPKV